MSLKFPTHARRRISRLAFAGTAVAALFLLSGCTADKNSQIKRLAMPVPRSAEGQHIFDLWMWGWLAAILVGILVWGLILYAVIRFRRRSDDEVPVQTRYNLPIEIFYTIAPIMMVIVFFFFTVKTQNESLHQWDHPDTTITVVAQQWSWSFNYNLTTNPNYTVAKDGPNKYFQKAPSTLGDDQVVHEIGTTAERPTLWLPLGKEIEFHLYSPDVIHSFWATDFLFKMDVVPGRDNHFGIRPTALGRFEGRCAELCGLYHSQMLFDVNVVTPQQYQAHLAQLAKAGQTGAATGGTQVLEQPGLKTSYGGQQ